MTYFRNEDDTRLMKKSSQTIGATNHLNCTNVMVEQFIAVAVINSPDHNGYAPSLSLQSSSLQELVDRSVEGPSR